MCVCGTAIEAVTAPSPAPTAPCFWPTHNAWYASNCSMPSLPLAVVLVLPLVLLPADCCCLWRCVSGDGATGHYRRGVVVGFCETPTPKPLPGPSFDTLISARIGSLCARLAGLRARFAGWEL